MEVLMSPLRQSPALAEASRLTAAYPQQLHVLPNWITSNSPLAVIAQGLPFYTPNTPNTPSGFHILSHPPRPV
jgi:hypothetical protein